jgi:iron complex outermembrane receptor protein
MQKKLCARAVASALSVIAITAIAQAAEPQDAVVVTGTPFGSGLFEMVPPAGVLEGKRLIWQRKSTLGETLEGMPGVTGTYFGPNVSRPVIRGLDGDRVRILQNGTGTLDASSLSADHSVPYDPLVVERVEVVRGPAAVLYGGNATGGVVNLIDSRIPQAPLTRITGRAEARAGGPDNERSVSGLVEGGNGLFAVHADVFDRRSGDLRIPGFARSARRRAIDEATVAQPRDRLPGSSAQSDGGTLGGSLTWGNGHLGLSHGTFNSNYGSVAEPGVRIDMRSERNDASGEVRDIAPFVKALKFKLGQTDYQHREIAATGAVNTTFLNRGHDGRFELVHDRIGPFQGAIGFSRNDFDFSALGTEAFVPQTNTRQQGVFIYEEIASGDWKLSAGLRNERSRVRSEGGGAIDASSGAPRFNPAQSRSFSANSSAFGVLYRLTKELSLAGNLSFTQRAPTYYELFANGLHAATGAYEVGNAAFDRDKSRSYDAGARWRRGPDTVALSAFRTTFANFITPIASGSTRDADGTRPGAFPEFVYQAVPAIFQGYEAQGRLRVYERKGSLDLLLKADTVKAWNSSTGQALPRVPPLRFGVGLDYTLNRFSAAVDLQHARAQNRVSANELPTDGYTLLNATAGYRFAEEPFALQGFVRATNLFNAEARNHVSFLKDRAPLGGRGILLGLRGSF